MPARTSSIPKKPLSYIWDDYMQVLKNKTFMGMTLGLPMVAMPLMLWIALSPVMLVEELGLSSMQYGLAQFPVLGGLILGTAIVVVGIIWREYFLHCVILGMTLVSFGTVAAAVSVLMMFTFFFVIELIRILHIPNIFQRHRNKEKKEKGNTFKKTNNTVLLLLFKFSDINTPDIGFVFTFIYNGIRFSQSQFTQRFFGFFGLKICFYNFLS
ncbi:unnamed protein product [Oppiella nova]|uniref:Uncharacterized protein n=1 Tax=Oppiella nova TaxID=334625 RepID=A0A7R9L703_9ACAR|nr:unnamed protein product [Oppiella nova]CAG2155620.1 unnamed protein product [Oppiella nova]